jgi:hypothetical protein
MPTGMVGWSGRGRDKPSPKWATGRRTGPVPNGLFAEDPEKLTGSPREVTRGLSVFSASLSSRFSARRAVPRTGPCAVASRSRLSRVSVARGDGVGRDVHLGHVVLDFDVARLSGEGHPELGAARDTRAVEALGHRGLAARAREGQVGGELGDHRCRFAQVVHRAARVAHRARAEIPNVALWNHTSNMAHDDITERRDQPWRCSRWC